MKLLVIFWPVLVLLQLGSCGQNSLEVSPTDPAEQTPVAQSELEAPPLGRSDPDGQDVGEGLVEGEDVIDGTPIKRRIWMGDLDGMADRGIIRALVVYSKTFYFHDQGQPRGITCKALQAFEEHVNQALKRGSVRDNVVFIPVHRDELIEALVKGKGDIAVSNLTITRERQRLVDFSDNVLTGVKEVVNSFVKTHRVGTSFGNTLLRRYTRDTKWVRGATSDSEMKKLQATVALFQKYADHYEFDWLMVVAQAYQESHLDQGSRSRVGAVGIMQVMPESAAGPEVNIRDITELENNIHAGVKLMHQYKNEYFNQPEIDELNRTLFTFAAYNAGPNRINRLRERATKQGLNPNVWFKNVGLVVAKSVGWEPVRYVGNLFTHYVAYKLVQERQGRL